MAVWTHQPPEQGGTYYFSGKFLVTNGVQAELTPLEIAKIYTHIQGLVRKEKGIDYLQVFKNKTGVKLFFIDQLNKAMIESGDYAKEHNYCTLMLASEY